MASYYSSGEVTNCQRNLVACWPGTSQSLSRTHCNGNPLQPVVALRLFPMIGFSLLSFQLNLRGVSTKPSTPCSTMTRAWTGYSVKSHPRERNREEVVLVTGLSCGRPLVSILMSFGTVSAWLGVGWDSLETWSALKCCTPPWCDETGLAVRLPLHCCPFLLTLAALIFFSSWSHILEKRSRIHTKWKSWD